MARARRLAGVTLATLALAALALAPLAPPARAAQRPWALVVGDSLEELTSPFLPRFLPGVKLTVNAVGGSNSYEIRELLEASYNPGQSVIVFDAGTNDDPEYPQILAENLAKAAQIVGDRCMVVPTIHGLTVNGVDSAGKNRVVEEFAASRPGTQVPNWAGFVATHPQLMQPDHLHPIEAGAEDRARLIAHGILGCLAGASTGAGFGPSAGAAAQSPESQTPVLKSRPKPLPEVHALARRREAIARALLARLIPGAAVAAVAALLR
jgi:hypothetical protein